MASRVYELHALVMDPNTGQMVDTIIDWDKIPDTMNTEMQNLLAGIQAAATSPATLPDGRVVDPTSFVVRSVPLQ